MLSIFPELLTYGFFAPFLLRIVLGVFFLARALTHGGTSKKKTSLSPLWFILLAVGESIIGLLFIVGLFTQVAALIGIIYGVKALAFLHTRFKPLVDLPVFVYVFVFAISLSLLVTGAGAWAIDLPF